MSSLTYGLQINNKKGIDNIIIELLPILQSGVKNDTLKDMIGFIDDTVLKLFSQLLNNQKVNIGFTQIDVKTNMEAVDLAKLSPEIFSSSPLAHEVIQDLIRSKAHSDRYKSEYSRSQISKHQINTLLSQKTKCLLEWVRNNCNDFQVIYHIHEILNSGDLIICNLDMHLFIVELYRILPKLEESQITQELEIHQLYNTKSNLLHLSGPGYIHDKFSPKFGISRVRIQPATIVDNNTNIFKKNDRLDLSVYQSREPIFKIIQASEQLQQTKLSLPEILSLLEHLIENDIAKKYQIDNFQGKTIVFLVLDIIQQQNLLENETETSNKLKSLFENQNLLTVLLI